MIGGSYPNQFPEMDVPDDAVKLRYYYDEAFGLGLEPIGPVYFLENLGCVTYKKEDDDSGDFCYLWVDKMPEITDDIKDILKTGHH